MAFPLSSNNHRYFTWSYIFIRHIYVFCLERLVWYESLLVLFCVLSHQSLLDTPFWESQKLCYACSYASLKFLEPWNCSSALLISFLAWCALLFLKKCSHASLRFIWELLKFWRNSQLLHLNYFERNKICYAHDLHLYLFELMKSNTWKLVPKW